ncbi:hypothetical protein C8322_10305 [Acinetobacter sp. SM1B]|nr:hypothetical protein C8322_10305 [Acinetobacter sp. SM1B]
MQNRVGMSFLSLSERQMSSNPGFKSKIVASDTINSIASFVKYTHQTQNLLLMFHMEQLHLLHILIINNLMTDPPDLYVIQQMRRIHTDYAHNSRQKVC